MLTDSIPTAHVYLLTAGFFGVAVPNGSTFDPMIWICPTAETLEEGLAEIRRTKAGSFVAAAADVVVQAELEVRRRGCYIGIG